MVADFSFTALGPLLTSDVGAALEPMTAKMAPLSSVVCQCDACFRYVRGTYRGHEEPTPLH